MNRILVLTCLMAAACASAKSPSQGGKQASNGPNDACVASPDAGCDTNAGELAQLERSRNDWDQLVATLGDTYSYSEENCGHNSQQHTVTTVQVDRGVARLFGTAQISSNECLAWVNRYESFEPHTMPELYDECNALVAQHGAAVQLEFDDRDVLRGCIFPGTSDCLDNCGEGFYLRALLFGVLEVP